MKFLPILLILQFAFFTTQSQSLFEIPKTISSSTDGAISIEASDFDLDGDVDLVCAAFQGDEILYYENMGSGNFASQRVITSEVDGPRNLALADIDNDGDEDLLAASSFDNKISYYENLGNGNFGNQVILTANMESAVDVYATDFDGDGDPDVISCAFSSSEVIYFENLGEGNFSAGENIATLTFRPTSVYAKDLDGDGDPEVITSYSNNIAYQENLGNGTFAEERVIGNQLSSARLVHAADLDNDGDADIISASELNDLISVFENLGNGNFGELVALTRNADFAEFVTASDLDGDGDQDVLFTSKFDDKIGYFENLGEFAFSEEIIISTDNQQPNSLVVADINGDQNLDIVAASFSDDKVTYFSGRGGLARVQGRIYSDLNNNNVFDGDDIGIKTTLEVLETGEIFSSHNNGLYSVLVDSFPGSRSLKVELPSILQCDRTEFVNYSFNTPANGISSFTGQPNSLVNMDFILDPVALTDCTTSSGFVYEDLNENGMKDVGERVINDIRLNAQNSGQTILTDISGYYEFQFSTAIQESIKFIEDESPVCGGIFEQSTPTDDMPIVIQTGMDNQNLNMGFIQVENPGGLPCYDHKIVSFAVYPSSFMPGSRFITYLDTKTIGTNVNPSTLRLDFDPGLELISVDWSPDEVGLDYAQWNFDSGNAPPSYCFKFMWKIRDDLSPGHIINWNASFTSTNYIDPTPANNIMTREKPVIFSRSNGGEVFLRSRNPIGEMPELLDSSETELSYLIFFGNNTLDSISDITIIDTLPEALNGLTLKRPFSSHPHTFSIRDTNVLIWEFKNIALPHDAVNPSAAFGFVQFNVNLQEGISSGTAFTNKAHVIFNNGRVKESNEITHRVPISSSTINEEFAQNILVFPNPVESSFKIEIEETSNSIYLIEIVNTYGQNIYTNHDYSIMEEISTANWAPGVYLIKATNRQDLKSGIRKLIKL